LFKRRKVKVRIYCNVNIDESNIEKNEKTEIPINPMNTINTNKDPINTFKKKNSFHKQTKPPQPQIQNFQQFINTQNQKRTMMNTGVGNVNFINNPMSSPYVNTDNINSFYKNMSLIMNRDRTSSISSNYGEEINSSFNVQNGQLGKNMTQRASSEVDIKEHLVKDRDSNDMKEINEDVYFDMALKLKLHTKPEIKLNAEGKEEVVKKDKKKKKKKKSTLNVEGVAVAPKINLTGEQVEQIDQSTQTDIFAESTEPKVAEGGKISKTKSKNKKRKEKLKKKLEAEKLMKEMGLTEGIQFKTDDIKNMNEEQIMNLIKEPIAEATDEMSKVSNIEENSEEKEIEFSFDKSFFKSDSLINAMSFSNYFFSNNIPRNISQAHYNWEREKAKNLEKEKTVNYFSANNTSEETNNVRSNFNYLQHFQNIQNRQNNRPQLFAYPPTQPSYNPPMYNPRPYNPPSMPMETQRMAMPLQMNTMNTTNSINIINPIQMMTTPIYSSMYPRPMNVNYANQINYIRAKSSQYLTKFI
jgi:hypothetical protein